MVISDAFAGTERYVCDLSAELAGRGHEVVIIGGGQLTRPHVPASVTWKPATSVFSGIRAMASAGRFDVVGAHLTWAEVVAVTTRKFHGAPVVATRHLLTPRGQSPLGRVLAPYIAGRLAAEVVVSQCVRDAVGNERTPVIRTGVTIQPAAFDTKSRRVLVAQRLEAEKHTHVALSAWVRSKLDQQGWRLVVAGVGSQGDDLARQASAESTSGSVEFVGHVQDMDNLWPSIGILLAPTPVESVGLTVLEAMARGVPVVAAAGGGHLETIGAVAPDALFPAEDADAAAQLLRSLGTDEAARTDLSARVRNWQIEHGSSAQQVDKILALYASLLTATPGEGIENPR